ncbi:DASH complex subunit ASK1, partial [Pichia kudriavzevii]
MSEETESRDLMEDEMQRQKRLLEVDLMERDETDTDQQPRLSFFFDSNSLKSSTNRENILSEIDRVEQLVTLNLQKINENIVLSNEVITNQLVPKLE